MKSSLIFISLFVAASGLAAPMSRFASVVDSRTIVVETNGRASTVILAGVAIDPAEERLAAAYLRDLLRQTWVLVEHGDVYRSPDGLYINGEMQRHAWRAVAGMRFLGPVWSGVRRDAAKKAAPTPPRARTASRPAVRHSARLPRVRSRRPE